MNLIEALDSGRKRRLVQSSDSVVQNWHDNSHNCLYDFAEYSSRNWEVELVEEKAVLITASDFYNACQKYMDSSSDLISPFHCGNARSDDYWFKKVAKLLKLED